MIGNVITFYRKQKRLTQEELAKKTGLSRGYIGTIEANKNTPPVKTLEKISNALDVDINVFYGNLDADTFKKNKLEEVVKLFVELTSTKKITWEQMDRGTLDKYPLFWELTAKKGFYFEDKRGAEEDSITYNLFECSDNVVVLTADIWKNKIVDRVKIGNSIYYENINILFSLADKTQINNIKNIEKIIDNLTDIKNTHC